MAGVIRHALRKGQTALVKTNQHHQFQQQRFAGDLPVKSNKYVEDWNVYRENVELSFKWDKKTITRLVLWAGIAPVVVYTFIGREMDISSRFAGRPEKPVMGHAEKS